MQNNNTIVINIVSGPGAGKTTFTALLFFHLKMLGVRCEYVQEYAKKLVWLEQYEKLNNQYLVSLKQYELFNMIANNSSNKSEDRCVDVVVTDGSLLHGLYYNRNNPNNYSNVDKTEEMILSKFKEFNNLVFFLERGDFEYEKAGRIQTYEEAIIIDSDIKFILNKFGIGFETIKSDQNTSQYISDLASKIKSQFTKKHK